MDLSKPKAWNQCARTNLHFKKKKKRRRGMNGRTVSQNPRKRGKKNTTTFCLPTKRLSTRPDWLTGLGLPRSPYLWTLRLLGPHEDLLTIVKRRKLQRYGHVSRSSGLAKTILQGTVKGARRQGRQRKRWEDNIRKWTGLEFGKSQRAVENRKKMEKTGCKIVCGAPTTLAVKGLMIMMRIALLTT